MKTEKRPPITRYCRDGDGCIVTAKCGDLVDFYEHDREVRRLRAMVLWTHWRGFNYRLELEGSPPDFTAKQCVRAARLLSHWAAKIEREETP